MKDLDMPHWAFSVFLFNSKLELLLQKRSKDKITFPNLWTNTCCSHPLYDLDEISENEGIKVAGVRWIKFELGIDLLQDDITTIQKILYKADSDEKWMEYELDYILFAIKDV